MTHYQYAKTVMPAVYCPADAEWIQAQIAKFSTAAKNQLVTLYADVYQAAWDEEQVSYRQENAARRAANKRLRLHIAQYLRPSMGLTEKPPLAKAQAQHGVADSPVDAQQDRK